jgi:hypothetical protein
LLFGCWDFEALSKDFVPPPVDASMPADIACSKMGSNSLQEDCTQNGDINNNCLYGCDDPTCSDHVACFATKGYKTYGAVAATAAMCPAQTVNTPIFQSLATPTTCNGSCQPASGTTSCTSTLHIYATQAECMGKMNDTKVAIADGNNACGNLTSVKDSYYAVDKLASGTCAPKNATVALTASWGTSSVLCDEKASNLLRFGDMQKNGVPCVVFSGTDTTVCASAKPYTKASVYYTGTDPKISSTCNCSATASGGCSLTNGATNLLNLTDKTACGGGATLSPIKTDSTCVQALDAGAKTYQTAAVNTNIVAPTCTATGTVAGALVPIGGLTVCCM